MIKVLYCINETGMKKLSLIFLLLTTPVLLRAQDSTNGNYPYWTITKEIQRHAYRNVAYNPATFNITDVSSIVSKNIQRKETTASKKVVATGYPAWTISKPAARQSFERNEKKKP